MRCFFVVGHGALITCRQPIGDGGRDHATMGVGDKLLGAELAKFPTYGGFRYVQLGADLGHRQSPLLGQQFQQDTPALSSVFGIRGLGMRSRAGLLSPVTTG
jgi:hypothetical protein